MDLPGAYSMSPFTAEESIASSYVKEDHPDVIVNIVDATNLSRSLFFTTQLLELGIPMVVALNKTDTNAKKETHIDVKMLQELLTCPVVETISTSAHGLSDVIKTAVSRVGEKQNPLHSEVSGEDVVAKQKTQAEYGCSFPPSPADLKTTMKRLLWLLLPR